jgi:uncharacterized membrane protein (UPF0182 family)
MRVPTDLPRRPRRPPRARPALILTVVVLVALVFSLGKIAGFYTDFLWFHQLGFTDVFTGLLGAKIFLAVFFTAVMFVLVIVNLVVADRLAPRFQSFGPDDELVQRYREAVGRHANKVRLGVAIVFALLLGTGQSSQWSNWILFRHAKSFGTKDAQFHRDVGFYVFKLPFLQNIVSWSFAAVMVVAFLTAVFYYLNGGIRLQAPSNRVSPQVKAHLSVLFGVLALIKAAGYYYDQFGLVIGKRAAAPVKGATYTDVHAQLPALHLLLFIMVLAFALFIYNIRLRGWTLPLLAIGLWFLVSVAVGSIYPLIIEQYTVKPAENRKEAPYIARNIAATRLALGIGNVKLNPFPASNTLTTADVTSNADTLRNIRLWDPALTVGTNKQLQELKQYYRINNVDMDRYRLGAAQTPTVLSVRELNQDDLPQNSWVNKHLQFTHGYGATLAPANAVTADGQPVFAIKDVPPALAPTAPPGTPQISTPGVYFGENSPDFSIVNTRQPELNYQKPDGSNEATPYAGKGGVQLSSLLRRLAFAARFGDINILISSQISARSRIIYIRNVQARVHKAAPFLRLDADPYAALVDGRIVWIQDAYTVTDNYPYSQDPNVDRLTDNSGLKTAFNYVRNSVKVVVDAYDGTTSLYVQDPTDPIVQAYRAEFPSLFKNRSEMSPDLVAHLRYPEELFKVQTTAFGRYHITDPLAFYSSTDAWNVAQDPGVGKADLKAAQTVATTPSGVPIAGTARRARQDPYYLELRLPDATSQEFQILQPFVPQSSDDKQENLTAFMVAKCDPADYGQLEVFKMPTGIQVSGPAQVDTRIQQDPVVSRDITLLNTNNSEADFGNILTIPIQGSLIYFRPLYVKSTRTGNPIPQFKKAIVVYGSAVAYGNSLQEALTALFPSIGPIVGPAVTPVTPPVIPPGGTISPPSGTVLTVQQLLQQAQADHLAADAALKAGDLATYQRNVNAENALIDKALAQLQATTGAPGSTTTTTAPSPSASSVPPTTTTSTPVPSSSISPPSSA